MVRYDEVGVTEPSSYEIILLKLIDMSLPKKMFFLIALGGY